MNKLDNTILKYLEDFDPVPLDLLLTSPNLILESIFLADNHKLKDEANIILDSLNSYNNCINNHEREEELLSIIESSPLYSWRCGTLAIKEFYRENHLKVTEYLNEVREGSPVLKLSTFLVKGKLTALFDQDLDLNISVDALKDVIENGMVDLYTNCVKLLLDDLNIINDQIKENIILTIIEESSDHIPLEVIHQSIINAIPITESTRLMALGTMFKYPTNAIQYLFSYFTLKKFTTDDDINLQALIKVISDLVKALIKEKYQFKNTQELEEFKQDSRLFIQQLREYFPIDYKSSNNPLTELRRALDIKQETIRSENKKLNTLQGNLF